MVNQRSPAKAPLAPAKANEQPAPPDLDKYAAKPSQPSRPQNTAPVFGQPTAPQSPFANTKQRSSDHSELFIQPKSRPEHHRPEQKPQHPHMQAAKDFAKSHNPFAPKPHPTYQADPKYAPPPGAPTPIKKPADVQYLETRPIQAPTYGSFGNVYGDSSSLFNKPAPQPVSRATNFVDLTHTYTPYVPAPYVDPGKASEDLKALLEGAIEDPDDMPRTRSRKKKNIDDLAAKLEGLKVGADEEEEEEEEEEDDGSVEGISVKLLPHQVEGLAWMTSRELGTRKKGAVPKGGILADDMGLGKTLQSISLIVTNAKPSGADIEDSKRKFPAGMDKGTLVVAPLALIKQWELEIKDKVSRSHQLRVLVHHGPQRTKKYQDLKKYDVVITTYQILVSEKNNSTDDLPVGCFGLHWYRVILDEAHTIKNRNAKATQACNALRSHYRWCLSGTPMQNNLDELQSLIKFLRIKPYDDYKEWKDQIDRPMKNGRGDLAIQRLRHYLKIFMKRRTKDILTKEGALNPGGKPTKAGDTSSPAFVITKRKVETVQAEFSPEERNFYEKLESRADASLAKMMSGEKVNYANALTLLLRLRQACNHPELVAGKLSKDKEALTAERVETKSKALADDLDDMADMFGNLGVNAKVCEACGLELSKEQSKAGEVHCTACQEDFAMIRGKKKNRSKKDKKHSKKRETVKEESDEEAEEEESVVEKPKKPRNRNVVLDSDDEEEAEVEEVKAENKSKKSRNRNVVLDSDDEEEEAEGEWIVGEDKRGPTNLGKAGGTDDENAEGGGDWLGSEDEEETFESVEQDRVDSFVVSDSEHEDSLPDIKDLSIEKIKKAEAKIKKEKKPKIESSDNESASASGSEDESDSGVEDEFSTSDEEGAHLARVSASTKITHLLKILSKEADEHKFIVFSAFTSMLDLIEPFLKRDGYKYTRYDGSMRNDLREASLNKLRNEKSCRVLLCSLKCGSLGLNLTAATRVVILEPFWNPFVEEQAIDRVHRLTQKIDVVIYKLIINGTVEDRILELQNKKRELANQAIEGGAKKDAMKLGMKEILQLFKHDTYEDRRHGAQVPGYDVGGRNGNFGRGSQGVDVGGMRQSSGSGSGMREMQKKSGGVVRKEDAVYGRRW